MTLYLAQLVVGDGSRPAHAADKPARRYRSTNSVPALTIIADLQASFRALTDAALQIRAETRSLQTLAESGVP